MTKKISITQFTPELQRQIKQAVAALSKKPSVLLASEEVDIDDHPYKNNPDFFIRRYQEYFKSATTGAKFAQDFKVIVGVLQPSITAIQFQRSEDYDERSCYLQITVQIQGTEEDLEEFRVRAHDALAGKLKVCEVMESEGADETDDGVEGMIEFYIPSKLVIFDFE